MKVKAKSLGFYNNQRQREGMIFELKDPKHFSEKWMVKFEPETSEQKLEKEFEKKAKKVKKINISKDVL